MELIFCVPVMEGSGPVEQTMHGRVGNSSTKPHALKVVAREGITSIESELWLRRENKFSRHGKEMKQNVLQMFGEAFQALIHQESKLGLCSERARTLNRRREDFIFRVHGISLRTCEVTFA